MGGNALSKRRKKNEGQIQDCGDLGTPNMVAVEANVGKSGVCYYLQLDPAKEMKRPPKLLSSYSNHAFKSSSENLQEMADDLEEKMFIANILREENLRAKGNAAREFQERQAKVMKRKIELENEKIQRVQEKLYMEDVRLLNRPRMNRPKIRLSYKPYQTRSAETRRTTQFDE